MALPSIIPSFPDINLVGGIVYSVQTIGATEGILFNTSIDLDSVVKYNASLEAVATDLSLAIGFERNIVAKNDAGVVTIGIPQDPFTDKDGDITLNAFWRVTGTILELVVFGTAGKTINWAGTVRIGKVFS